MYIGQSSHEAHLQRKAGRPGYFLWIVPRTITKLALSIVLTPPLDTVLGMTVLIL